MHNRPSRHSWLIPFLFALCTALASAQYFPKQSLDDRGDEFRSKWYSRQLHALKEPSLLTQSKNPNSEAYRFLWLRTFHHPVAIRVVLRPDGTGVLTTKVASGAGGYSPGVLKEENSRDLT